MWCKNLTKNSSCHPSPPSSSLLSYSPFLPLSSHQLFLLLALIYLRWAVVTSRACLWRRHCVCTATTEGRAKQSSLRGFVLQTSIANTFFILLTYAAGAPHQRELQLLVACLVALVVEPQMHREIGCIILPLLFVIFTVCHLSPQLLCHLKDIWGCYRGTFSSYMLFIALNYSWFVVTFLMYWIKLMRLNNSHWLVPSQCREVQGSNDCLWKSGLPPKSF